jgi:hypothetical protein
MIATPASCAYMVSQSVSRTNAVIQHTSHTNASSIFSIKLIMANYYTVESHKILYAIAAKCKEKHYNNSGSVVVLQVYGDRVSKFPGKLVRLPC